MNIKKTIAERLLADTEIAEIVGSSIYRDRLPKTLKPPHIIVWQTGKNRIYNHDGYSGLTESDIQISCFSHDPDEADNIAELVKGSLESWTQVEDCFFEGETNIFEEDTLVYHVALEAKISYHE